MCTDAVSDNCAGSDNRAISDSYSVEYGDIAPYPNIATNRDAALAWRETLFADGARAIGDCVVGGDDADTCCYQCVIAYRDAVPAIQHAMRIDIYSVPDNDIAGTSDAADYGKFEDIAVRSDNDPGPSHRREYPRILANPGGFMNRESVTHELIHSVKAV